MQVLEERKVAHEVHIHNRKRLIRLYNRVLNHNLPTNSGNEVLYDFICSNNGVSRHQINDYVYPLYESKNIKELNNKVRYLLTKLKNENLIKNVGSDTKPLWIKK